MKPSFVAVLVAAAAATAAAVIGCAPLDLSVFVEGARAMDQSCNSTGETALAGGSLDLGPLFAQSASARYYGLFDLRSDLQALETASDEDVLAGSSRNDFVATSINLDYAIGGATTTLSAIEPIYFVVPPESTSTIRFNMISPALLTQNNNFQGTVPVGGSANLLVTFHFEGNIRASSNALFPMRTQPVTFPIQLFNQPQTLNCPDAGTPKISGPCGNSQDNFTLSCQ